MPKTDPRAQKPSSPRSDGESLEPKGLVGLPIAAVFLGLIAIPTSIALRRASDDNPRPGEALDEGKDVLSAPGDLAEVPQVNSNWADIKKARAFPIGRNDLQLDVVLARKPTGGEPHFLNLEWRVQYEKLAANGTIEQATATVELDISNGSTSARAWAPASPALRARSFATVADTISVRIGPLPIPSYARLRWTVKCRATHEDTKWTDRVAWVKGTAPRTPIDRVDCTPAVFRIEPRVETDPQANAPSIQAYDRTKKRVFVRDNVALATDLSLSTDWARLLRNRPERSWNSLLFPIADGILGRSPSIATRGCESLRGEGFELFLPSEVAAHADQLQIPALVEILLGTLHARSGISCATPPLRILHGKTAPASPIRGFRRVDLSALITSAGLQPASLIDATVLATLESSFGYLRLPRHQSRNTLAKLFARDAVRTVLTTPSLSLPPVVAAALRHWFDKGTDKLSGSTDRYDAVVRLLERLRDDGGYDPIPRLGEGLGLLSSVLEKIGSNKRWFPGLIRFTLSPVEDPTERTAIREELKLTDKGGIVSKLLTFEKKRRER